MGRARCLAGLESAGETVVRLAVKASMSTAADSRSMDPSKQREKTGNAFIICRHRYRREKTAYERHGVFGSMSLPAVAGSERSEGR
jgi:hypothetical protein